MKTINDNSTGNAEDMWSSRSFHMRSFLAAALFLAMLVVGCSVLSVAADEADAAGTFTDSQGIVYTTDDTNNTATVTDYTKSVTSNFSITINSSVTNNGKTYTVTAIGSEAFYKCFNETLTSTYGLTSVTIPDSVTSIERYAFGKCVCLTSVTLPSKVTSIGEGAFFDCALTSVTIPNTVTEIGNEAFDSCDNLATVTFNSGSKLTSIGDGAFRSCYALKNVDIPTSSDSLINIGKYAFQNDSSTHKLESVTIGGGVSSLGEGAFNQCYSLTTVTFNGVSTFTSIGEQAFYRCSKLTSITIPDSVTSIGRYAFCDCIGLTSVIFGSGIASIDETAFSKIFAGEVVFYDGLTKLTPSTDVEKLKGNTFTGTYDKLVKLDPTVLTTDDGFQYKLNLENKTATVTGYAGSATALTIPATVTDTRFTPNVTYNVTAIGAGAFKDNAVPSSLTIADSVTSIGENAFSGCTGLTSVSFGNGLVAIADWGVKFYGTDGKTQITDVSKLNGNLFKGTYSDGLAKTGYITITYTDGTTKDVKGIVTTGTYTYDSTVAKVEIRDGITGIDDHAFWGCENLTEVSLPDSLKSIGTSAFYDCAKLEKVTFGSGVTSIGDMAFYGCKVLKSGIKLDSVKSIGGSAFYECELLESEIKLDSIESIGNCAFQSCSKVTTLTLGNKLTSIEFSAFSGCSGIKSVVIPNQVTAIEMATFYMCSQLATVTFAEGSKVASIGQRAFYSCSSLESIILPDKVTEIGNEAFSNCTSLKSVNIPGQVTVISDYTFNGCGKLTSITIPDKVTEIGEYAFHNCVGLTSINIPLSVTTFRANAFTGDSTKTLADSTVFTGFTFKDYKGNTLTADVANLPGNTFTGNGDGTLTQKILTIDGIMYALPGGSDVTVIDCIEGKTDVAIPTTVTDDGKTYNVVAVGNNGFKGNTALKTVSIPESVKSIGASAFSGCTGLTKVIFGKGIESIGTGAFTDVTFYDSEGSETITVSVDNLKGMMFELSEGKLCQIDLTTLTVDGIKYRLSTEGSVNTATAYGYYRTDLPEDGKVTIPQTVSDDRTGTTVTYNVIGIGKNIFYNCTDLKSITIPDSVTSIGENAFYSCTGLTSVALGNGIKSIEEYLFYGCTSLSSVTIQDKVTSIGKEAFTQCTGLTGITIPKSVTTIGYNAFSYCSKLESVTFENGSRLETIDTNAFYYCSALASISLPDSVKSIGKSAFFQCEKLTEITIPNSVTEIESSTFAFCKALTTVTIPNTVTSIGTSVFQGCEKLTGVTIPNKVTAINNGTFYECTSLSSIIIPNSVTSIGPKVFYGCTGLKVVVISASVTSIESNAFGDSIKFYDGTDELAVSVNDLKGCTFKGTYDKLVKVTSFTAGDFEYTLSGSEATVSGYTGTATDLTIPETATDSSTNVTYTVTGIGEGVFKDKTALVSVTLPDKMTTIGNSAFKGCTELQTVTMPKSFTSIKGAAFSGCTKLANITIPDSVTFLGANAFNGCAALVSITIPNGVETIEGYTFANCTKLASVTISDSVTSIDADAFSGCTALTTVTFGNGVETVGNGAFGEIVFKGLDGNTLEISAANLKGKTFKGTDGTLTEYVPTVKEGGIVYTLSLADKTATVSGYEGSPTNVTILSKVTDLGIECSVTSIGENAFKGCTSLVSIVIPDSVTEVKECAFEGCTGLKEVTLGKGITKIAPNDPFKDCSGIKLTVLCSVSTNMFTKMDFFTELILGDNITIGELAFNECDKLVSVTFGNGITAIGDNAFFQCAALETVVLSDSVADIGNGAFMSCPALKSVTFGTGVTTIGSNAFSVKFKDTEGNDLEVSAANMKGSTFTGSDGVLKKEDASILTENGIRYKLSADGTATVIGYTGTATDVTIPSTVSNGTATYNVIKIGDEVFKGMALTSVVIGDNVTDIGKGAFSGITSLTSVTFGKGVRTIAEEAFYCCTGLKSVTIGTGVKTIGNRAFYGCIGLTSVTFNGNVETIGIDAFNGCTGFTSVEIPDSVKDINASAFSGCTSLKSVRIGNHTATIGERAFYGCPLTFLSIPASVTTIGEEAFNCVKFYDSDGQEITVLDAEHLKDSTFEGTDGSELKRTGSAGGSGDDGLSTGAVVTVWIGILLAILVIICAYLYYRKMNSQEDEPNSEL